jgi:hypothetical protein
MAFCREGSHSAIQDSNNPLAVELERENDPGRETFSSEPL